MHGIMGSEEGKQVTDSSRYVADKLADLNLV